MRKPRIPGTIGALNQQVQEVLTNRALTPEHRGNVATALILSRVVQAYKVG